MRVRNKLITCPKCSGSGTLEIQDWNQFTDETEYAVLKCDACSGYGTMTKLTYFFYEFGYPIYIFTFLGIVGIVILFLVGKNVGWW